MEELQMLSARHIHITGVVQGVGFRPFVYNLATRLGVSGWVLNSSSGVEIEAVGPAAVLDEFAERLRSEAPPLARIEYITVTDLPPSSIQYPASSTFVIRHSEAQPGEFQPISPDIAICDDCLRELFDPNDRRYRYPFINCTNCGPRFTIMQDIPYDRSKTTMAPFKMCPDCQAEYDDPTDRRFHAQPNACSVCGPRIWLHASRFTFHVESEVES
nr:carbamoyltransferase HypF [Anaerolineae bacterium]